MSGIGTEPHDLALTTIRACHPVVEGRGFRSARQRFHDLLAEIGVCEVLCATAVAEYSLFYRSLPIGTTITTRLQLLASSIDVQLEAELGAQPSEPTVPWTHFEATISREEGDGPQRLQLHRTYPRGAARGLEQVSSLLHTKTAEELEQEISQTKASISDTESRLSSVLQDLKIAADIQQRMLASKEKLLQLHNGIDCHAYMVPCRDIGGDFYDVISLDTDHIAVIVGDVSGKGITAAMMMATCMTLLRAFTESFRAPSRIMRKINPRLIEGNETDCLFTTLFVGIINTQRHRLTYCNAGHNPAIVQRADGSVDELEDIHGPAVGVIQDVPYEQSVVPFHPGDRLVLYTDGASETFNPAGDLYGTERLIAYCNHTPAERDSASFLEDLLEDLARFSQSEPAHDDVTLVSVRRDASVTQSVVSAERQVAATMEGMAELMKVSDAFCSEHHIAADISGRLQLVLDELLINVVNYGRKKDADLHTIKLALRYFDSNQLLVAEIRDSGAAFNPFALAEPDTDLSIDERQPGGLGIFLVRDLARSFSYTYEFPWNIVLLEIDCQNGDNP